MLRNDHMSDSDLRNVQNQCLRGTQVIFKVTGAFHNDKW